MNGQTPMLQKRNVVNPSDTSNEYICVFLDIIIMPNHRLFHMLEIKVYENSVINNMFFRSISHTCVEIQTYKPYSKKKLVAIIDEPIK